MAGVRAGGDRQALHEVIRKTPCKPPGKSKNSPSPTILLDRLAKEPSLAGIDLGSVLDPIRFVGRAPEQVQQFNDQVIEPIRAKYQSYLSQTINLRV